MTFEEIRELEDSPTRRRAMKIGGALTASALAWWWSWEHGLFAGDDAAPYKAWQSYASTGGAQPTVKLVRSAVLASNSRNTQPWKFRVFPDAVDVFADSDHTLSALDPLERETRIGAGAAVANLMIAAQYEGFQPSVTFFPVKNELPFWIAHVALTPARPVASELYAAIPKRHTNRGAYAPDPVAQASIDAMTRIATNEGVVPVWITAPADRQAFSNGTIAATKAILDDPDQSIDSARWNRPTWREVKTASDGLTVETTGRSAPARIAESLMPMRSARKMDEEWLELTREVQLATAPLFGMLLAPDPNDISAPVRAGIAWQKIHLWATANDLAGQPLTAMLQRSDREKYLKAEPVSGAVLAQLAAGRGEPLFAFRVGHPKSNAPASPRRPVESVLAKT